MAEIKEDVFDLTFLLLDEEMHSVMQVLEDARYNKNTSGNSKGLFYSEIIDNSSIARETYHNRMDGLDVPDITETEIRFTHIHNPEVYYLSDFGVELLDVRSDFFEELEDDELVDFFETSRASDIHILYDLSEARRAASKNEFYRTDYTGELSMSHVNERLRDFEEADLVNEAGGCLSPTEPVEYLRELLLDVNDLVQEYESSQEVWNKYSKI